MHDLLISPINLDARARAVLRIGVEAAAAATSARMSYPSWGIPVQMAGCDRQISEVRIHGASQ